MSDETHADEVARLKRQAGCVAALVSPDEMAVLRTYAACGPIYAADPLHYRHELVAAEARLVAAGLLYPWAVPGDMPRLRISPAGRAALKVGA
jgi:hypothetical protein